MKVAELREKGKELELDVAGKKKAELVEEIYVAAARAEGFRDIQGILDITNEGFGYIRAHGYMPSRDDAFVSLNMIRAARLRPGDVIEGTLRPSRANDKFPGLAKIRAINGKDPEEMRHRPKVSELTPIYNAISHFFGPCDFAPFDDFARAFSVASVLAVDCGCCSFSCLVASASPCAPVGDDMGFLLFVFSIMCCDCG